MSPYDPGRAAAEHIVRSPATVFTPAFQALAAPFLEEARQSAQPIKINYYGQAKVRRERELREELA